MLARVSIWRFLSDFACLPSEVNFFWKESKALRTETCQRSTMATLTFRVALMSPLITFVATLERPGRNYSTTSALIGLNALKICVKCSTHWSDIYGLNFCCVSLSLITKMVHLICSSTERSRASFSSEVPRLRSSASTFKIRSSTLLIKKSLEKPILSAMSSCTNI